MKPSPATGIKQTENLFTQKVFKMNVIKPTLIAKLKIDHELLAQERTKLIEQNVTTRVTNAISDDVIDKVCEDIKKKLKIESLSEKESDLTVIILLTGLLQNGGTNRIIGNGIRYSYNQHSLDAKTLNDIIKKHQKNGTIRQLARSLANDIAEVAITLNIEGDLANQMRMDYPDLTDVDAAWCSNFQTTNSRCPEEVRNWLVDNYRNRFNR